eukprot:m.298644 g.298644  ORF g.298644 m.298644 type:complete len:111 (+) comp27223_c0_seq1:2-334(+)
MAGGCCTVLQGRCSRRVVWIARCTRWHRGGVVVADVNYKLAAAGFLSVPDVAATDAEGEGLACVALPLKLPVERQRRVERWEAYAKGSNNNNGGPSPAHLKATPATSTRL